jgi:hypothetical protein
LHGEDAAVPVGQFGGREKGGDFFGPVIGKEPFFYQRMDVIELRDLDEDWGHGKGTAGDKFKFTQGSEQLGTASGALGVLPALTLFKSEDGKEAGEAVKFSARGDGADQHDSLNHRFDCIVWEYGTRSLLLLAGLNFPGR